MKEHDPKQDAAPSIKLRKRAARVRCEDLFSSSGPIIDLSLSGARIAHRGFRKFEEGETIELTLAGYGAHIVVPVRVARINRVGFMHFELGVEFISPDEQTRQAVADFVRCHSVRYSIVKNAG